MTEGKQGVLILEFSYPHIFTHGERHKEKREKIRKAAFRTFKTQICYPWYSFEINIQRSKQKQQLDVENVSKLIIDAFSGDIMERDNSKYRQLELYPDDDLRYVRHYYVEGALVDSTQDNTAVKIYGHE